MTDLTLSFDLKFTDLYARDGLVKIDRHFLDHLGEGDAGLADRLLTARLNSDGLGPGALDAKARSELIVALAPHLEDFVGRLFRIEAELGAMQGRHHALAPLYTVKRLFVQRRAVKGVTPEQAEAIDGPALAGELEAIIGEALTELSYANHVTRWGQDESANTELLDKAARYAAWAALSVAGRAKHHDGVLFKQPHKLDMENLVPLETENVAGVPALALGGGHERHREGFALTDQGADLKAALDNANYCIWCANQGKDSCSKGLKEKTGSFKKSHFGVPLAGCPLEEKISEMNQVKAGGNSVGALAITIIDNPMTASTGHRICNDCMKACIYQKQEPVDIPQIETRTLKDVLGLPWGFEIYGLLTRWNPLNLERPLPKAASGYKVLVVGLGPSGFTLAHHLMNDGHAVVGVDGLKIEPLPEAISGVAVSGGRVPFKPILDVEELYEALDERVLAGFGGVAEYGITVRWNKNYLKLVRLLLERRQEFAMFGGIRFGGTIDIDDAFAMGFDHVALCAGAGRPTIVPMENGLVAGVRQASDFLMALQLTGAAKQDSIANLLLRLPVVVIGGGLTAIDTATESVAYYPVQVEKFLARYEILVAERGEAAVRAGWTPAEAELAEEFLLHAHAIRAERALAAKEGRRADLVRLIDSWGGVTLAYRRRLIDSPSYTLNHEEVAKALEEGIRFAEGLTPKAVETDAYGAAKSLRLTNSEGAEVVLPARAILVAAGTQPNTVLGREYPDDVAIDGKYFQAVDEDGQPVQPERSAKPAIAHVLMRLLPDGKGMSFFGDLHPSFAGNVVKAMASAKNGYPVVSRVLAKQAPSAISVPALFAKLNDELRAVVQKVVRLTPTIVEVVVRAPLAARKFEPGQFYRLQNYETQAMRAGNTILAMEGLALTGAWVDREQGLLSTIVLEMGGSSDLCAYLKPGEPVILMGPTGTATETPSGETVLLIGGGLGNAVLFSIGQALRAQGSKVLYVAGYREGKDRYKVEEIEKAADVIVWACNEAPAFPVDRPQDKTIVGNIIEAIAAYGEGKLGDMPIPLSEVDRIIAIGSDGMMAAVREARRTRLASMLKPDHCAIGSINSPMQCMMKEICAQCLQVHKDPVTGQESVVFTCFNQDQDLDKVDFANLRSRLGQNGLQEKLTKLWIDRCLKELGARAKAAE